MSRAVDHAGQPMPPVVTLFESYGSGAGYIGPRVAQALGIPFHEQAFSSQQLEQSAELREREGLLARVLGAMSHSSFGGLDVGDVSSVQRDRYDLVMQNTGRVQQWARGGGVIVGRNGAFILVDWPTALHVQLDGPVEQRIARAAAEAGIPRTGPPSGRGTRTGSVPTCRWSSTDGILAIPSATTSW